MLAPSNAPAGTGSIQLEIYYSKKYMHFTGSPDDCIEPAIRDLRRCGLLRDEDQILFRSAMLLPYGNIIFDQDRAAALRTVHGYLDDIGIAHCGRYGDWGYMWTDESFKSGEAAAQQVLDRIAQPADQAQNTFRTLSVAQQQSVVVTGFELLCRQELNPGETIFAGHMKARVLRRCRAAICL